MSPRIAILFCYRKTLKNRRLTFFLHIDKAGGVDYNRIERKRFRKEVGSFFEIPCENTDTGGNNDLHTAF